MPRKQLSPKMAAALKLTFQAEVGISRTDQNVARSGIIESWMIHTSTHAALIDRNALTPMRMVYGGERDDQGCPLQAFGPLVQITAAGCEAIGRSMDEIVAWAWDQAVAEYSATMDMQVSAYRYAAEVLDSPRFPKGTPEYDAYATELHAELEKFANGEPPYGYGPIDKTAILSKPIDSLMNSGVQDYTAHDDALLQADLFTGLVDRKALPITPPAKPRTLLELIKYHGEAFAFSASSDAQRKARETFAEIERRLNLAAALMPAEVREILDGHAPAYGEPACATCGKATKRNGRGEVLHADYLAVASDHTAVVVVDEQPSFFAGGAPVRTYSNGSQSVGPHSS